MIFCLLVSILLISGLGITVETANYYRPASQLNNGNWRRSAIPNTDIPVQISIALSLDNVDLATNALLEISDPSSANYGKYWTSAKVLNSIKPTEKGYSRVFGWLRDFGVNDSNVVLSSDGGSLRLTIDVQRAARLLQTSYFIYTDESTQEQLISNVHYWLPAFLSEHIDYVTSAAPISPAKMPSKPSNSRFVETQLRPIAPAASENCTKFTTPECLRKLYNIPRNPVPHPNSTLGVFEPTAVTWLPEDLDYFFSLFQPELVGQRPVVDPVDGGYMQTDYKITPFNLEPNLDFQYAMALTAPQQVHNIQVGDLFQTGTLNHMLAAFDNSYCESLDPAVDPTFPDTNPGGYNRTTDCGTLSPPSVVSISFAYSEAGFPQEYLRRQCLEFLKLGLMGVTVIASSGDYGPAGSAEAGRCLEANSTSPRFNPSWPCSCPWVTAVGGTQLFGQSATIKTGKKHGKNTLTDGPVLPKTNETSFYTIVNGDIILSSGGGFSNVFRTPEYQQEHVSRYQRTEEAHLSTFRDKFNSSGRGYPDLAVQSYGYLIGLYQNTSVVHGTSAAAPVLASMVSMINSERLSAGKSQVGFINPALYAHPEIFNDVATGGNEGCGAGPAFCATEGWDAVTGLGSPEYGRLRDLFMSLP